MSSTLLRTLTKKSKFNIWKYQWTVGEMFTNGGKLQLVAAYYKLTTINYTEDILAELGITQEWQIEKPGSDKELYYKFLDEKGYNKRRRGGADKLVKMNLGVNKAYLQAKNHGK